MILTKIGATHTLYSQRTKVEQLNALVVLLIEGIKLTNFICLASNIFSTCKVLFSVMAIDISNKSISLLKVQPDKAQTYNSHFTLSKLAREILELVFQFKDEFSSFE